MDENFEYIYNFDYNDESYSIDYVDEYNDKIISELMDYYEILNRYKYYNIDFIQINENILKAIKDNNEKMLLENLLLEIVINNKNNLYMFGIMIGLIKTNNVHFLNIFMIYGANFNDIVKVYDAECEPAYLGYQDDQENCVKKIIDSNLRWCYDKLLDWYVNPVYYTLFCSEDYSYILKLFIHYNIIESEFFIKEFSIIPKIQFIKNTILKMYINTKTGELMKQPVTFNYKIIEKTELVDIDETRIYNDYTEEHFLQWTVEDVDDELLREDQIKCIEKITENKCNFYTKIIFNWNYINHKEFIVCYSERYLRTINTIFLLICKFKNKFEKDGDNKYVLPQELWNVIIGNIYW